MIPDNIVLTYRDYNIPPYVFDNIQKLNPDKEILFYSNDEVVQFLLKEYDSSYVDLFYSVKLGCTKGDLFRYCYLFKYGGYYCDIDIYHFESINNYISKNTEFFSINSQAAGTTFQALLYCEAGHPIIKNCIDDLMNPESAKDLYYLTTGDMYKNIKNYLNLTDKIIAQDYTIKDKIIGIGQESMINNMWSCTYKNKVIALSRYPNYRKMMGGTDKEIGYFT